MAIYREQFLPRFQEFVMRRKATRPVRARVCEGLRGDIVEIGFGTGLNAPFYPDGLTKVLAVETRIEARRLLPLR